MFSALMSNMLLSVSSYNEGLLHTYEIATSGRILPAPDIYLFFAPLSILYLIFVIFLFSRTFWGASFFCFVMFCTHVLIFYPYHFVADPAQSDFILLSSIRDHRVMTEEERLMYIRRYPDRESRSSYIRFRPIIIEEDKSKGILPEDIPSSKLTYYFCESDKELYNVISLSEEDCVKYFSSFEENLPISTFKETECGGIVYFFTVDKLTGSRGRHERYLHSLYIFKDGSRRLVHTDILWRRVQVTVDDRGGTLSGFRRIESSDYYDLETPYSILNVPTEYGGFGISHWVIHPSHFQLWNLIGALPFFFLIFVFVRDK